MNGSAGGAGTTGGAHVRFDLDSLATELGAEPVGASRGAGSVMVDGLGIDTRALLPGQLFAAITAERDGHEFVPAARAAGAAAVLVQRVLDDGPALVVPDVEAALGDLARLARAQLHGPVVGITGSVGKTTTKDLLANVLASRFRTAASKGSFNNELGVPLTLFNAPEDTEATVVEMGARGAGHIAALCAMATPDVGVVTAVQAVHTEVMGTEDDIAAAKGELIEALPSAGLAVLNAADPRVLAMASLTEAEVLTFAAPGAGGAGKGVLVTASDVRLDDELRATFRLESPWGHARVHLGARGEHNVANALAAASVGLWADVEVEAVADALGRPLDSPWRMQLDRSDFGLVVLNDAYNAGPASMAAALRALSSLPARRRVAVLGVMAELGSRSRSEHEQVADLAAAAGIELVAVGTNHYGSEPVADSGAQVEAILATLADRDALGEGTAILVKGSRVAGLETLAAALSAYRGPAGPT